MFNVDDYLKRIGLSQGNVRSVSAQTLALLQSRHVLSVPYENIDIIHGKPISLNLDDIYDKIVVRGRGGYCFELNALYSYLLTELGFSVKNYFARFWRGETDLPLRRHRVITVDIDGVTYFTDVGIGSVAPRFPLVLERDTIQTQGSENYKFTYDENLGWMLHEFHSSTWQPYLSFTTDEAHEVDFIQPSFYCQCHPDSPFNKYYIVAIKTSKGRRALNGRDYKEFTENELTYIEENCSDERLSTILREKFNVVL